MRTRAAFLSGAAVGYVLGARAGRERYEQIVQKARQVWEDPRVQETVGDVQERATQTASAKGKDLQDKVMGTARDLTSSARRSAGGGAGEGSAEGETVVLTTYDSASGSMETTTVDISEGQAGSNGRLG